MMGIFIINPENRNINNPQTKNLKPKGNIKSLRRKITNECAFFCKPT